MSDTPRAPQQHKKASSFRISKCADKPSGCAESLGQELPAHPLGLSAHRLRIELLQDYWLVVKASKAGLLGSDETQTMSTTQKTEYLHYNEMRRQAKWMRLILRTGAFGASTRYNDATLGHRVMEVRDLVIVGERTHEVRHTPMSTTRISRCADKPSGCAKCLGQELSAHPLALSAHCLRIELLQDYWLVVKASKAGLLGSDETQMKSTTTQKTEYLHYNEMRRQAKWMRLILRTGAFGASTWLVGASPAHRVMARLLCGSGREDSCLWGLE
jgi:D-ribose pyranose/furanose isomerase RbsD